jgi:putative intracellular protease/amidase
MNGTRPLEGKKIAVLVETEYVPAEIEAYRNVFGALGAQVDIMSRLWDQQKLTFVSDVDNVAENSLQATQGKLQIMEVNIDFEKVDLNRYHAVLMAANYCSVRLRYFQPPNGSPIQAEMARTAPAVKFFGRAMRNPRIVKGALCHALWLLTPSPELLAGRRILCNEVVISDIVNAGATYVPSLPQNERPTPDRPASGVVVDDDLITGDSYKVAAYPPHPYIMAIKDAILRLERNAGNGVQVTSRQALATTGQTSGPKKVLIVLSERGYWGEELVGPLNVFDAARYTVEFATPTGKRPRALPPSFDPDFIDPPLNRPVVSEEMAQQTKETDDVSPNRGPRSRRLDNPKSLAAWVPERPYWSHPNFVRVMEAYNRGLSQLARDVHDYDALLIVGGSGPIVDLVNNQRVHDLILAFYRGGKEGGSKPIAAECYGVPCLAFARDPLERKSIIWGKRVTGHCLEYDYKDGTGFIGTDFNMGPPPYPLEYILRDAVGPDGEYIGNFGKEISVIVDYPFITGRSTPDSLATGEQIRKVLEDPNHVRYGW